MSNGDWRLLRGWGWRLVSISVHAMLYSLLQEGEHILAIHMPVSRDRETDACPQCQGLTCFHSLTAPPTVSSYITPSPSPGPLPAFIGLFLSFSTLALHPTDRCPPPPIIHLWFLLCNSALFLFQCRSSWTEAMDARLDDFSKEFLWGAWYSKGASFERTGADRILQGRLSINGAV